MATFEEAIKNAYKEMDVNKDGIISKDEIQILMTQMWGKPVPGKVIDEIMKVADKDKSGSINTVDELVSAMCEIEILQISSELRQRFIELDKDGNGKLTRAEITEGWKRVSKGGSYTEMLDIIQKADTDGDGMVSCDEFISYILQEMMG